MSLTAKFLSLYGNKHKSRKSSGSPNFPRAFITQYTSAKHEQILNSSACATESESGIILNHNEKSRLCTEYYLRGVHLDERSLWTCSSCYLLLATYFLLLEITAVFRPWWQSVGSSNLYSLSADKRGKVRSLRRRNCWNILCVSMKKLARGVELLNLRVIFFP